MTVPLAAAGGSSLSLFLIILIPVAMYFLMIRPQQRRMREAQAMQSSLAPGDEVVTTSGIYGTVEETDDDAGTVTLEVSAGVSMTFARGAVARVLTRAAQEEDDEAEEPEEATDTEDVADQVIKRKD